MFFQIFDDVPAAGLLNFQTADINTINGISIDLFEILLIKTIFDAMVNDECTLSVCFYHTVTAAIFLGTGNINGYASFFQFFAHKIPIDAAANSGTKTIRHTKMTEDIADIISTAAQRTSLASDMDIFSGFRQFRYLDDHIDYCRAND